MNKLVSTRTLASLTLIGVSLVAATAANAVTPSCTPTGFVRDAINLTAELINPAFLVKGDVDATGCNIGIYYGPGDYPGVDGANVHGANYFGVVNNGGHVTITNSTISDIGEKPLNGSQHGVEIYFASASTTRGNITNNILWNYQKGGITVIGPASAKISNNTVLGQGPVSYIAQNGIEVGQGANVPNIEGNSVYGNSYTGAGGTSSAGILLFGGACFSAPLQMNTEVHGNTLTENDVGIWFANYGPGCTTPASTRTDDVASQNRITNNGVNNTSGNGSPPGGYQAGIADIGDGDHILHNAICGLGYAPVTPPPFLFVIDVTFTTSPHVSGNTFCGAPYP